MCRPPSSGRVRRRACGLPYPASGRRSRLSVALHVCFLTGVPWRRRHGRCHPFHARIPPRRRLIVQRCPTGGGEAVIPRAITGFSLSKPVPGFKTGYRFSGSLFSGSRLTSLVIFVKKLTTKCKLLFALDI